MGLREKTAALSDEDMTSLLAKLTELLNHEPQTEEEIDAFLRSEGFDPDQVATHGMNRMINALIAEIARLKQLAKIGEAYLAFDTVNTFYWSYPERPAEGAAEKREIASTHLTALVAAHRAAQEGNASTPAERNERDRQALLRRIGELAVDEAKARDAWMACQGDDPTGKLSMAQNALHRAINAYRAAQEGKP